MAEEGRRSGRGRTAALPDEETGAVNVPLLMARKLKTCGVALVDEALLEASPTEYAALKKREQSDKTAAETKKRWDKFSWKKKVLTNKKIN